MEDLEKVDSSEQPEKIIGPLPVVKQADEVKTPPIASPPPVTQPAVEVKTPPIASPPPVTQLAVEVKAPPVILPIVEEKVTPMISELPVNQPIEEKKVVPISSAPLITQPTVEVKETPVIQAKTGNSSMRIILVVGIILVVLGGLAAGYYFFVKDSDWFNNLFTEKVEKQDIDVMDTEVEQPDTELETDNQEPASEPEEIIQEPDNELEPDVEISETIPEPDKPEPKKPDKPDTETQTPTINLTTGSKTYSFGRYQGSLGNGIPEGQGTMHYTCRIRIAKHGKSTIFAENGDTFTGTWSNGDISKGTLYDRNNISKAGINVGKRSSPYKLENDRCE